MIGEIINDKYKIDGAFSESRIYEVFTATELATGTVVVVKIMKPKVLANNAMVSIFTSEVKSFAKLSHPFVAEILDIDMFGERPYIVTPLVVGRELNLLLQEEVLPFDHCLNIVRDLGSVLQHASDEGIDCRTVKLSNVLVGEDKKIKLLSFTQPRLRSVTTAVRNESAGIHSDLYFLGITLYELLAGESPIRARGGLNELWDMKLERSLRIRHSELPPKQITAVIEFISKTITRDTNLRFENHEEYLMALAKFTGRVRNNARKGRDKQLCIAAQVVDALNGASNLIPMSPPANSSLQATASVNNKPSRSKAAVTALNKEVGLAKNEDKLEFGKADLLMDGNLALVSDNSMAEEFKERGKVNFSKTNKPERSHLRVVKPELKQTNSCEDSEWAETGMILKNPVVYLGIILVIMVALILFW